MQWGFRYFGVYEGVPLFRESTNLLGLMVRVPSGLTNLLGGSGYLEPSLYMYLRPTYEPLK